MSIPNSARHRLELMNLTPEEMNEVLQDLAMSMPVEIEKALDTVAEVRSRRELGW